MRMVCVMSWLLLMGFAQGEDYPQFRGPKGNGIATAAAVPTTWAKDKNVAWMTKIPGTGWSQPIVVGKKLFVTTAVGENLPKPKDMQAGVRDMSSMGLGGKKFSSPLKWQLFALDAETGAVLWEKTVAEGIPTQPIHPSNTYATESPCADKERVYVHFGMEGTLAAYSHDGERVWKLTVGAFKFSNGFGSGSSLAIHDGKIYMNNFNENAAFVACYDGKTGQRVWHQPRQKAGSAWASPLVWKNSKRTEIIAAGDKLVTSHDPNTGEELWRIGGIDTAFSPSPAVDGDVLLLGASSPFSAGPLMAIAAGAQGDITLPKGTKSSEAVTWFRTGGGVGMSSPVATGGYLSIPGEGSLTCVDIANGKPVYKERLPKSRMVAACPVVVGDKLLLVEETGKATWVKTGPQFEVLEQSELPGTFWASPAIAGDVLYLRSVDGIYCIKKTK
jgi:outer membrane protein assembly factor BamB